MGALGLSVGRGRLCAVRIRRGNVAWVGQASWTDIADLAEAVARLASECPRCPRRVRAVLERDLVQARTIAPAPPLRNGAAQRYLALAAFRLFRDGQEKLVTDGAVMRIGRDRVLYSAAADEAVTDAIARGCQQAGLLLEALGPATDVLPFASGNGATGASAFLVSGGVEQVEYVASRAWRSRLLPEGAAMLTPLAPALSRLGDAGARCAAAFGAARRRPRLSLLSVRSRTAAIVSTRRRTWRLAVAAAVLWTVAPAIYIARLHAAGARAERFDSDLHPRVAQALRVRRDLAQTNSALGALDSAMRHRSRNLALLANLSTGLSDSVVVLALEVSGDSLVQVSALAPSAARAVAELERLPALRRPRIEGIVGRQAVPGNGSRDWDQFTVRAGIWSRP